MPTRSRNRRWRRLERWQVLLAAVVAAVASIVVVLIGPLNGGSTPINPPTSPPPISATTSPAPLSIAITSEFEEPHSPPPGRLYMWSGTVRNLPTNASIFVIDKLTPTWLVSPAASISRNGIWAVSWVIPKPPATVRWIAVVQVPTWGACPAPGCPSPFQPPFDLASQGSNAPGVVATATYRP